MCMLPLMGRAGFSTANQFAPLPRIKIPPAQVYWADGIRGGRERGPGKVFKASYFIGVFLGGRIPPRCRGGNSTRFIYRATASGAGEPVRSIGVFEARLPSPRNTSISAGVTPLISIWGNRT